MKSDCAKVTAETLPLLLQFAREVTMPQVALAYDRVARISFVNGQNLPAVHWGIGLKTQTLVAPGED